MNRRLLSLSSFLVLAGALAACQAPAPGPATGPMAPLVAAPAAAGSATIVVTPQIRAGGTRRLAAAVTNYTEADVNHLGVRLFKLVGGEEVSVASDDVLAADLQDPLTFSNLKNDETYRIRAYAYKTAGTGDQISLDESSYVDLVVVRDNEPVLGALVVQLMDVEFSGEATSSGLTVVPGGFSYPAEESITH